MTNLTEKWKKGELPDGWYWVEGSRAEGIYAYTAEYLNNMYRPRNGERIIEKAPSYKEWEDLKSKLQLKETAYDFDTARLEEENTKLKELLKDAREVLKMVDTYSGDYDSINGFLIVERISQVLANNQIQANTLACNKIQEKNNDTTNI